MRGLTDKVVIVTGGARGIGAALCRRLVDEGAKVAIFDLLGEAAAQVAAELHRNASTARAYVVDITDRSAVDGAVARVEADIGPVDVLINNAGKNTPGRFIETDAEHWRTMIDGNLIGALNMHHAVLSGMTRRARGRIVNIASDAGRVGSANEAVYSACKGGIIAFAKALAREVAAQHITINTVCPGPTETQLFAEVAGHGERAEKFRARLVAATPMGRMGHPDDVVGAVCFLASDDAAFITGQTISVSGGLTMV